MLLPLLLLMLFWCIRTELLKMGSFNLGLIAPPPPPPPPTHPRPIALWAAYISSQAPLHRGIYPKHMVIGQPSMEEPLSYVWGNLGGIWAYLGLFWPLFGPF